MNKNKRQIIFSRLAKQNPNPTTELIYKSNFELLIAVILSAQATDISVNKVTARLFKLANTPETVAALGITRMFLRLAKCSSLITKVLFRKIVLLLNPFQALDEKLPT